MCWKDLHVIFAFTIVKETQQQVFSERVEYWPYYTRELGEVVHQAVRKSIGSIQV